MAADFYSGRLEIAQFKAAHSLFIPDISEASNNFNISNLSFEATVRCLNKIYKYSWTKC
jgi:hypothetical protein